MVPNMTPSPAWASGEASSESLPAAIFLLDLPDRIELGSYEHMLPCIDVEGYVARLVAAGDVAAGQYTVTVAALKRAALYFLFGRAAENSILANRQLAAGEPRLKKVLKRPTDGRYRESYAFRGCVWILADTWQFLGGRVGTSWSGNAFGTARPGKEVPSRFMRFASGFLQEIESTLAAIGSNNLSPNLRACNVPLPKSRKVFRVLKAKREAALGICRPEDRRLAR